MKYIRSFLIVYSLFLSSSQVFAQSFNAGVGFGKPSEFVFQSYKNQELISLRLLGAVNKAGLYHVPKDIKLITLLSLAGGTSKDAEVEQIMIGSESRKEVIKVNLYEAINEQAHREYEFNSNDTIFVKHKKPFISNDSWKIISVISVLLTTALTAIAIDDKI
ncbi:hypothetical protein [Halobacteriovorax sp. JY17]|uniref:hypothetical protein n=1 Tax=Halobacteriovorax sp. JY17 TaxID=2014617 RepID=UPI000C426133|nr:hypothetical protein [Halobacteriovorax sp. JY17]PIK14793.1 MAG: hypothetical protein CES88_10675 [Halobacteriovorax sp. JY17]